MKTKEKLGCKYCLMSGETGISFKKGNIFDNDEDFANHIERVHDIPVGRDGETEEETLKRFHEKNKRAGTKNCRCPSCLGKQRDLGILGLL